MRTLLSFLLKHYFTILFLILEIIAFSLLLSYNSFHNARIFKVRHNLVGSFSDKYNNFSKYISLVEKNKVLVEENAKLYSQLDYLKYDKRDYSFNDSIWDGYFRLIPAEVINNSVNKQYNFITLNRGSIDGIEPDMGVVCPDGLVGVVKNVTEHFSTIVPVLNREFNPNARIETSNFFGYIEWPGNNYRKVVLKDIPLHARINIGDTIVTSGFTTTFPQGIPIGTITDYEIDKGVNYNISVELTTDFKRLTHVWVIENLLKEEQKFIEDTLRHD
ncbi:MAG: rod shape-determining protein MreC [Bacteroidales bacterium]|nr:rod shape-determining protein MreC [Bacteroidales bacterium]MBN2819248.1 rod shape-determining protein MreC [Bacteroidales bacterium]